MSATASRRPAESCAPSPPPSSPSSSQQPAASMPPRSRSPSPRHHRQTDASSSSSSKESAVPPTVKKGNRLAQFLILSALSCVLYQFVTNGGGQLTMKTDTAAASHPSGSGNGGGGGSVQFSSSEYTCILACMGLFGLIRHKSKEAATKQGGAEEDDEEEQDELARELLLAEKRVRAFKRKQDSSSSSSSSSSVKSKPAAAGSSSQLSTTHESGVGAFEALPQEILHELLLFLRPKDLSQCPVVSKYWNAVTGDDADDLWKLVFARDFKESGARFQAVFPVDSWRQFYFQHHLSRAVELARLLGLGLHDQDKKLCVAIENQVYDVTSFIHSHPGGYHVIGDVVGTDATEIWDQFQHSQEAKESMKEFMVYDHILSHTRRRGAGSKSDSSVETERVIEPLRGNLAVVITRWERISWCLANAHSFGPMASAFTDVMFKFHARAIKKSRETARLGLAN